MSDVHPCDRCGQLYDLTGWRCTECLPKPVPSVHSAQRPMTRDLNFTPALLAVLEQHELRNAIATALPLIKLGRYREAIDVLEGTVRVTTRSTK